MSIEINVINEIVQIDETSEVVQINASGGIGVPSGGLTNQFLAKNSNTNYDFKWANVLWGQVSGTLSDQTDLQNALNLKVPTSRTLTINEVAFDLSANRSWTIDTLPSQTGNSGKYLTTNGTVASWGTINLSGYVPYTGATGAVNLGAFDLLVQSLTIGKGNSALSNNTALGYQALFHVTTGNFNTAGGYQSLHNITTGQYNTALGQSSMFTATSAAQNVAIGLNALLYTTSGGSNVVMGVDGFQHNTTGASNVALGYNAGSHITGGSTPNTTSGTSIFIGRDTKALADGQSNQIVIGYNAVGNGSNTATIGNSSITANYFTGSINGGSFVKSGGTSSQFLKADGSVDSSSYVTSNIYTANGTLTADRTITSGGFVLNILGGKEEFGDQQIGLRIQGSATTKNPYLSIKNTNASGFDYAFRSMIDGNFELMNYPGTTILKIKTSYFQINANSVPFTFTSDPGSGVPGLWMGIAAGSQTLANSSLLKNGNDTILSSNSLVRFYNGTNDTGRIFASTGNWLIQTGGTFTDAGYKLDVNGTARVSGDLTVFTSGSYPLVNVGTSSTRAFQFSWDNLASAGYITTATIAYPIFFRASAFEFLRGGSQTPNFKIATDGKVSIANSGGNYVSSPLYEFSVNGSIQIVGLRLTNSTGYTDVVAGTSRGFRYFTNDGLVQYQNTFEIGRAHV
jgi:hypothetical protein